MIIKPGDLITYRAYKQDRDILAKVLSISGNGEWLFVRVAPFDVTKKGVYDQIHPDQAKKHNATP